MAFRRNTPFHIFRNGHPSGQSHQKRYLMRLTRRVAIKMGVDHEFFSSNWTVRRCETGSKLSYY